MIAVRPARVLLLAAVAALVPACTSGPKTAPPPPSTPQDAARGALERGDAAQALSLAEQLPSEPATWVLQGQAWARLAQAAPLPTPPPPPSPLPRGAEPPQAPEFKPEELKALDFFERAAAADPRQWLAHLGVAELLAPHAVRRHEAEAVLKRRPAGPPTPVPGEPDWSVERILRAYQQAVQVREGDPLPVEALIAFGTRVGRAVEVDEAYKELIRRKREDPEPLVRHGDFLARVVKNPERAVEQYQQALIWRPSDAAITARLADVYLGLAGEHLRKREYMAAQVHVQAARRYVTNPTSPQAQQLRAYEQQLQDVRSGIVR